MSRQRTAEAVRQGPARVNGLTYSGDRVVYLLGIRLMQQPVLRLGYVRGLRGAAPLRAVGKRKRQLA
jgi:hypothetical protein